MSTNYRHQPFCQLVVEKKTRNKRNISFVRQKKNKCIKHWRIVVQRLKKQHKIRFSILSQSEKDFTLDESSDDS